MAYDALSQVKMSYPEVSVSRFSAYEPPTLGLVIAISSSGMPNISALPLREHLRAKGAHTSTNYPLEKSFAYNFKERSGSQYTVQSVLPSSETFR
jgi:hypothetical protein